MMAEAAASPLSAWESFYVIVGSSGAALIGLQFVVLVLIADLEMPSTPRTIGAYGTPTIVHFAAALFVSAEMSAPWPNVVWAGGALGLCGVVGVVYLALNSRRAVPRGETDYQPVMEDWTWHVVLPMIAYVALILAGFTLKLHVAASLFAVGAAALSFLFIGIHNAWDTIVYIVLDRVLDRAKDRT
jgi:hypothetical protein